MKNLSLKRRWPALALAATLTGGVAASMAQTSSRPAPQPRAPQNRVQAERDRQDRPSDGRDVRTLIEDLENSTSEEVYSGRISRYFTDPAVIITNGRAHSIDWYRVQREYDRNRRDRDDRFDREEDPRDDERFDRRNDVRIENYQTRRIDPQTMVALYTAVFPNPDGVFRQPVVATLVRESSTRGWRVASYTAENAAVPGGAAFEEDREAREELPLR
jgi:hypothetical protein